MSALKPYPAMKASGVSWLGEVPAHWEVRRLKYVLRERDIRSADGSEQLLRVSQYTGVTQRRRADGGDEPETRAESLVGYKCVEPHDFVVNIMLAWNGSMGVSGFHGIVSPSYCVYRFGDVAHPWYFHHLLRSPAYKARIKAVSTGVVESRLRLYTDDIYRIEGMLPPLSEQSAIVRFLDYMDRRIRRYIRAKQKLIKLLEEQKQAIIHRAVTRGLDPNVRLKLSGVEWLGDVPEHWKVTRLKFIATQIVDCLHATPVYSTTGEYPAIRTADVQPGQLLLESARLVDEEHYLRWTARMTPEAGDILYTREGERFGIAALVPANVRLCISQRMMAFRIQPIHNSAYIMWQINCRHVYRQAAADLVGAAAPHVNVERIRNFWLVLPPGPEQEKIVAAVRRAHAGPNTAIAKARNEISLLREYRTRLIADVVTGKLDAREVAARLPDKIEEPELLDDADVLTNADEDAADDHDAAPEEDEP
jgi:type I restriction enzyme S subunit